MGTLEAVARITKDDLDALSDYVGRLKEAEELTTLRLIGITQSRHSFNPHFRRS